MMGHKDKLKSGMEYDVIFARRIYCYLVNNNKLVKYVKTQLTAGTGRMLNWNGVIN